ncbi:hypothetical protein CABS01_02693 [Colletotrichum abscissum]|uniref:uncharacterized protein n=1 Tax=Colletotrichum abscissum TaxID=1671311 RepID=UPI0027D6B26A|nr:uncharacterized protein CABS01_02693 [Colletotrichum abscissum]KAK1482957.1 hypothetical protein CABS01_02693 [Colletotrichum abscissum]
MRWIMDGIGADLDMLETPPVSEARAAIRMCSTIRTTIFISAACLGSIASDTTCPDQSTQGIPVAGSVRFIETRLPRDFMCAYLSLSCLRASVPLPDQHFLANVAVNSQTSSGHAGETLSRSTEVRSKTQNGFPISPHQDSFLQLISDHQCHRPFVEDSGGLPGAQHLAKRGIFTFGIIVSTRSKAQQKQSFTDTYCKCEYIAFSSSAGLEVG